MKIRCPLLEIVFARDKNADIFCKEDKCGVWNKETACCGVYSPGENNA